MVNKIDNATHRIDTVFGGEDMQGILTSLSQDAFDRAGIAVEEVVEEAMKIDYAVGQIARRNVTKGEKGEALVGLVAPAHTISHAWETAHYFAKKEWSEDVALALRFRVLGSKHVTEQAEQEIERVVEEAREQEPLRLLKPKYSN